MRSPSCLRANMTPRLRYGFEDAHLPRNGCAPHAQRLSQPCPCICIELRDHCTHQLCRPALYGRSASKQPRFCHMQLCSVIAVQHAGAEAHVLSYSTYASLSATSRSASGLPAAALPYFCSIASCVLAASLAFFCLKASCAMTACVGAACTSTIHDSA